MAAAAKRTSEAPAGPACSTASPLTDTDRRDGSSRRETIVRVARRDFVVLDPRRRRPSPGTAVEWPEDDLTSSSSFPRPGWMGNVPPPIANMSVSPASSWPEGAPAAPAAAGRDKVGRTA
jgi:hypothetical protein